MGLAVRPVTVSSKASHDVVSKGSAAASGFAACVRPATSTWAPAIDIDASDDEPTTTVVNASLVLLGRLERSEGPIGPHLGPKDLQSSSHTFG